PGAPEGLCVVAREQTAGRGRLNRSWYSPQDAGLYLSIVLRPTIESSGWPLLTLMTAIAVSESLMKSCRLRTDIKWPNDVCANDRKLCGILAETVDTPAGTAAIIGVGINLLSASVNEELAGRATSIETETNKTPDGELLLRSILKELAERYELLQSETGGDHIINEWCVSSSYAV